MTTDLPFSVTAFGEPEAATAPEVQPDIIVLLGNTSAIQQDTKYPHLTVESLDFPGIVDSEWTAGNIATALDPDPDALSERASDDVILGRLQSLKVAKTLTGNQITLIAIPWHNDLDVVMKELAPHLPYHLAGGTDAAWVESSDPLLAQTLARKFNCPVGRPDGWEVG